MNNRIPPSLINYQNQMDEFMETNKVCPVCFRQDCEGSCQMQTVLRQIREANQRHADAAANYVPSDAAIEREGQKLFNLIGARMGGSEAEGREIFKQQLEYLAAQDRRRRRAAIALAGLGAVLAMAGMVWLWSMLHG